MTGIYNVRNYVRFALLDPAQTTFAHVLKDTGYATCVAGKWQLAGGFNGPAHFGFDEYCLWFLTRRPGRYPNPGLEINGKLADYTNGEYGPDVVSDYICDFMERKKDQAFLVYYPMILPHWPFEPTPDSADWNPENNRDTNSRRGHPKHFADMVAYTDKMVGKIVHKLETLGLRENTLVLFTADNGTETSVRSKMADREVVGGKGKTADSGTRVPLIANWPGVIPAGKVSQDLVDFSDFLPTLCDCAGVPVPQNLNVDGRSFRLQLCGEKGRSREWIYCWYSADGKLPAREFTRNQRYKLYRTGEFYDIGQDELETRPLHVNELDPEAAAVRNMLQDALDRYKDARPEKLRSSGKEKDQKQGEPNAQAVADKPRR